ncbi:MAG: hypothetical protein HeimC2_04500 [Candidatus Heimdallarchaeota archaeon LC_2]|nr:MAG: hypothetical protein HeimC2_04500 [Candidatus Heimdallarchaeota archaeon LC_2]
MSVKFLITFSVLIFQILAPQPILAAPIFSEGFENSATLIEYIQHIPLKGEVGITANNKYSGTSSLHMKSTNEVNPTIIRIPLNLEFVEDITISLHHFFTAGIPYYWIVLEGETQDKTNIEIILEYGSPGPYWFTDSIAFVREFDTIEEQWIEFKINVMNDLNFLLSEFSSPWENFTPTKIQSMVIGLNPIWEPYTERNIYIDNLIISDEHDVIDPIIEITSVKDNVTMTDLILPHLVEFNILIPIVLIFSAFILVVQYVKRI